MTTKEVPVMMLHQEPPAFVARPDKLIRIAAVAKAMLEEARTTPCDAVGCEKFRGIYERIIDELDGVVSPDLHGELLSIAVRFETLSPSPSALRIAQAELVGWLDGLMNGIVIAMQAQEVEDQADSADGRPMPGQYL